MATIIGIHWILGTGASDKLSAAEIEVAKQIGAMLERESYGFAIKQITQSQKNFS